MRCSAMQGTPTGDDRRPDVRGLAKLAQLLAARVLSTAGRPKVSQPGALERTALGPTCWGSSRPTGDLGDEADQP